MSVFSAQEREENWQPKNDESDPNQGVDFLDSIMADYQKQPIKRGALKSLHESIKGKTNPTEPEWV